MCSSCKDCGMRKLINATAEFLHSNELVESHPQIRIFPGHQNFFEVDSVYKENGIASSEFGLMKWVGTRTFSQKRMESLGGEYNRLVAIGIIMLSSRDTAVPDN